MSLQLSRNLESLPELCYSVHMTDGSIVILKRGETGYYPTDIPCSDALPANVLVDQQNEKMGITKAQRLAMEIGSLVGFHVPGANPAAHEERLAQMEGLR